MALRAGGIIHAQDLVPEPWQNLELQNGWEPRAGYVVPSFRKIPGQQVQLIGGMIGGATETMTVFATLPEGYRPSNHTALPLITNAGETVGLFVRLNGDLEIFRAADVASFTAVYFTASFPLDR